MTRYTRIPFILSLFLCLTCFDLEPTSDPVSMENVVGTYAPNHSGAETLLIRSDYVWVRSYGYPNGKIAVDSGVWELDTVPFGHYSIGLTDMFYRYPAWIQTLELEYSEFARSRGYSPATPVNMHKTIRNKNGRIYIRMTTADFSPEYYYEKIEK